MRKGILFLLIFFFLFSLPVNSYSKDLKFVIIFDSNEENTIDRKNEIVELINNTLEHVDENSHYDFLKDVHDELESENRKVDFEWGTIIFHLGDSKGLKIEGNLLKNSFCMVEVKPKSLLKQWFKF